MFFGNVHELLSVWGLVSALYKASTKMTCLSFFSLPVTASSNHMFLLVAVNPIKI